MPDAAHADTLPTANAAISRRRAEKDERERANPGIMRTILRVS